MLPPRPPLPDVAYDRHEVAHRAEQHKKMPDTVRVAELVHLVQDIEDNVDSVGQATEHDPVKPRIRNGGTQTADIQRAGPAHAEIQHQLGGPGRAAPQEKFGRYSQQRQPPHQRQDTQTAGVVHADQHERGVGTGDQQVDRDVVENPEDFLQTRRMETVVEGRHRIQQNERAAENAVTYQNPRLPALYGNGEQRAESDQRKDSADQVADTVQTFAVVHCLMRLLLPTMVFNLPVKPDSSSTTDEDLWGGRSPGRCGTPGSMPAASGMVTESQLTALIEAKRGLVRRADLQGFMGVLGYYWRGKWSV